MTPQQNDPKAQVRQQVQEAIGAAQIPDDAKAQAWDAFFGSTDAGAFRQGMNSIQGMPNELKLKLTGLKFPEASGRVKQQPSKPTSTSPTQLIPSAPPGSEVRQQKHGGGPLPPLPGPDASSLWGAVSTPLTQTFGMDISGTVARQNRAIEAATPGWFRPIQKLESGVEEGVAGAAEQLTSPLSILLAPLAAMDGAGAELPQAVQIGKKALGMIGGATSASDAASHVYKFLKSGEVGELGKAATEIPLSILGFRSGVPRAPAGKETPRVEITGEAEPVTPPDYSQPKNRLGEGAQEPRRISNVGRDPRQLEAPSAERTQIETIANSAGPFKSQVYEWSRQPLAEIAKQREQALKNFQTVQGQFSGETAPFSGQPGVTNVAQSVPKGSTSQIPTGKGDFTAGGPRVLLDRARAQYEALDKLYQMKARAAGISAETPAPPIPGTQMGTTSTELAVRQRPPQPVPGAIQVHPFSEISQRPPMPTGSDYIPASRQLPEPEARVMSPNLTMEQNLDMAQYMPREVLAKNIEDMRVAAAQHAADMVAQAKKDPSKLADVKRFIEQAKSRLDQFQELYDRVWKEEPEEPTPESVGKKLTPEVRRDKMRNQGKGERKQPQPKATALDEPPKKKAPVLEMKKRETNSPKTETTGAAEGTISQRINNQLETAKASGLKSLKLTIDRGPGKNPLVIGVNPEFDTPEELARQIVKAGGASGMATMASDDPERPVTWKFLIGEASPPPGAK